MESCALIACVETIDYHSHLGVAADINSLEGKIKTSGNKDGSLQVTTTFTLETSDYSGTPSDHLVVVPSLVVKFAEVRVVSFNFTSCESNVDTEIQWTLDKANEIGAFSIKSYKFIEIEEVGEWVFLWRLVLRGCAERMRLLFGFAPTLFIAHAGFSYCVVFGSDCVHSCRR